MKKWFVLIIFVVVVGAFFVPIKMITSKTEVEDGEVCLGECEYNERIYLFDLIRLNRKQDS